MLAVLACLASVPASGLAQQHSGLDAALRAEISVVAETDGVVSVTIVERKNGVSASRTLKTGDIWRDGWKVESLTAQALVLRKGGSTVSVDLVSWGVAPAEDAAPGEAVRVSLTNADRSKPAGLSPPPDLAALMRRAEQGDELAVYALQERNSPDFEEFRARRIAEGKLNAVRMMDGLEPAGPDVIPFNEQATYDTVGYIVGTDAQGRPVMYRTQALYDASRAGR